jgi:CHAD domain-containing protein
LLLSLGGWLSAETWLETLSDAQRGEVQEPVAGFARTVLDTASKRVSKRGRHIDILAPRELHRLRIAVKKLRYAGDFFAPLYPRKRAKPYLARLAELQQVLGIINDMAIAPQLLAALGAPSAVPRAARDFISGWNSSIRWRELKRLTRAWQQFKRAKTFW